MSDTIFARVEHGRTADEVVHQIEILILEGILRVGDRLPGERELSRRFEVSRPILREALKVLETRGLLVARHGGGTFVADVIGQVFTRPVMELIARHSKATQDYLEYRREVEGVAAEFAALRATDDDKALLTRIITAMKDAHEKDDFAEEAAIDVEFHNAIGECAHNIILLHTLRSCYRLLTEGVFYNRAMIYTLAGARAKLLAQHMAVYEAVMEGDPAAARQAAQAHMDFVVKSMAEAQRTGEWERISRLRLQQRVPSPSSRPKVRRTAASEAAH
ncbi:FCD domain-containing protein [Pseudohoeflea coraliihabitans]|uniref:FCD domain-containing protein n=1 Tax=Pseudohoeflea coraliihabitans TaxID=2860393 RepID=A0ABS6WMD8_9HYPH|nr:FCD domain-containing protein [Pseudohoeflea sp. DP4N28-3]MBW3097118.1 FCD domain-containing protein [Pseudohoeflea sp. DP4N28-3]